jgi:hypothetical protein
LTVAGQSYSQPLTVKLDPRIQTSPAELLKQFDAATKVSCRQAEIIEAQSNVQQVLSQARQLRSQIQNNAALALALDALIQKAEDVAGTPPAPFGLIPSKPPKEQPDLSSLIAKFAQIFSAINNGDSAPTSEAMQAFAAAQVIFADITAKWIALTTNDLPAMNTRLKQSGFAPIMLGPQSSAPASSPPCELETN